jgi:hypothetical protein
VGVVQACNAADTATGMWLSCRFSMYEPVTFMKLFLAPYLEFEQKKGHVALHVPCTSKQAGLTDNFVQLASKCSQEVSLTGTGRNNLHVAWLPFWVDRESSDSVGWNTTLLECLRAVKHRSPKPRPSRICRQR